MARALAVLSVLVGVTFLASSARACTPGPCGPGLLLPGAGTLPANGAAYFRVAAGSEVAGAAPEAFETLVRVYRVSDRGETPVPFEITRVEAGDTGAVLIRPREGWARGGEYRVEANPACGALPWMQARFRVTPSAPMPRALGRLRATPGAGQLTVRSTRGSCREDIDARWVDVEVRLDPSARPWRDVLLYRTSLDDDDWSPRASLGAYPTPGRSWRGRGVDRVFLGCRPPRTADRGATAGRHRVRMHASVPGGPSVSTTPARIELRCASVTAQRRERSP